MKIQLPKEGESDLKFEWVSATTHEGFLDSGFNGFHCLTDLGRENWLKVFNKKFDKPNPKLKEFVKKYSLPFKLEKYEKENFGKGTVDPTTCKKFQFVHLCIAIEGLALRREDMTQWANSVGIEMGTTCVIQSINKCYLWGLKHIPFTQKRLRFYFVPHPFEITPEYRTQRKTNLEATNSTHKTKSDTKTGKIAEIKRYIHRNFIKVTDENWDEGHMDPGKNETVYQPNGYQRSRKDHYKFDKWGLVKCPTSKYLIKNIDKFYPDDEELEKIYVFLKKKLKK